MAPWTVACYAPLSMEFSRQEYPIGSVAILFSRGLPDAGRFFIIWVTNEALLVWLLNPKGERVYRY